MTAFVFGKYAILRRLAIGGMGEIFLAKQTGQSFNRFVILKRLLPDLAEVPKAVDEFLDEARVISTLNHPNIVAVYEAGVWENMHFIAMEYIQGENVGNLIRGTRENQEQVPFTVTAQVIHDAARALDYAHNAKGLDEQPLHVVHRDISPQNIMVRTDGVTKVVDFGIAKANIRSTRTTTGILKGRLRYMPPEQLRSEDLDHRSDQFSLGVVFWEMCTGRRLFKNDVQLAERIANKTPLLPPSRIRKEVPPELDLVVARMLEYDRTDRFPSCKDVADVLHDFLSEQPKPLGNASVGNFVEATAGEKIRDRTREHLDAQERLDAMTARTGSIPTSNKAPPSHPSAPTHNPQEAEQRRTASLARRKKRQTQRRLAIFAFLTLAVASTYMSYSLLSPNEDAIGARPSRPPAPGPRSGADPRPRGPKEILVIVDGEAEPFKKPSSPDEPLNGKPQPTTEAPTNDKHLASNHEPLPAPRAVPRKPSPPPGAKKPKRPPRRKPTAERLTATFGKRKVAIQRCTRTHSAALPRSREIIVHFAINRQGRVTSAGVDPAAFGATTLGQCILGVAKATVFGRQKSPLKFKIPLTIGPSSAKKASLNPKAQRP